MRRFYDVIENAQPVQVDNANQLSLYIELKIERPIEGE